MRFIELTTRIDLEIRRGISSAKSRYTSFYRHILTTIFVQRSARISSPQINYTIGALSAKTHRQSNGAVFAAFLQ